MIESYSLDLFQDVTNRPGSLGCRAEIAATMAEALRIAAARGVTREDVAERMAFYLGDKFSPATLNGYTAPSHTEKAEQPRDISLMRAMAFDAALGEDVLLALYARKRGERRVVTADEAAYIELGRIHQQEKELAERKRALQTLLKSQGSR
jgi:hypothetical protein